MSTKVAFIGLGNMGGPMAKNLVSAGCEVCAFDLSPVALQKAQADGCTTSDDPRDAASKAEIIITMLPSGPIVESVYIHDQALLSAAKPNSLFIDCSTVAPENSRAVAKAAKEHGQRFIDAPVSGGTAAAAAGSLAFMCGGDAEDVQAAYIVLEPMGANIFHAGGHGAGSAAKLCNNMLLAIHMAGTAEALKLGMNNGLDPKVLSEIMLKSSGCNWSLEKYNPVPGVMENVPASNDYKGGFMTNLMLKDLGLALDSAKASSSHTPLGNLAQELYIQLKEKDVREGVSDFSRVLEVFS